MKPIRLLIADHHPSVREGLRALIKTEPGIELAGEAADGVQVVEQAHSLCPDVILLDLVLPSKDSLKAMAEIKRENPQVQILVLSNFADNERINAAMCVGAAGYLFKDSSPQQLLETIRQVYQGEPSTLMP